LEEDGFVMRIFSNGFVVFVPRFGIEGLIRLRDMGKDGEKEPEGVFDAENYSLEIVRTDGNRTVELFEKMRVRIEDEAEESTGKRKIRLQLV
jgi:exosome complex exonuclease DIS3/RRP44